jgi:superfamily II DNA or RNA helicase
MQREVVIDIDPAGLERAAGHTAYARGKRYAEQHAVVRALWSPESHALVGTVHGSGGNFYTTTVRFANGTAPHTFQAGECSCPVGADCKHVVALVLAALEGKTAPNAGAAEQQTQKTQGTRAASRPGEWESQLGSLLGGGSAESRGETPLAIELTLAAPPRSGRYPGTAGPRLEARLVQPGKRGRWVAGNLSWSKLDMLPYYGNYSKTQVRILRELHSMYHSAAPNYYAYRDQKSIELSAVNSRQLWPLLDEAAAAGLRLRHGRTGNDIGRDSAARLCLDATGGSEPESLRLSPVAHVEDGARQAVPLAFVGADGHGLVYTDEPDDASSADPTKTDFRLARLETPAPQELQRMVLAGRHLDIPAADAARFRDEYYPRLRALAPVISSDGAFEPPEISEPSLVLHADYGTGHDVSLRWEWSYQIGEDEVRVSPERDPSDGYRDPAAERAVLAGLDAPLEEHGLRAAGAGHGLVPRQQLDDLDTMRFTTELLPLLADSPDVTVEVTGEPADYREAGDSLRIGVSTDGSDGETDWFDLGVSITLEGREVPFADVFTALARDESHMLRPDGAYFSLGKPELQSLRRLIEEARTLVDTPSDELKISRFQAGLWEELAALGVVEHQASAWRTQVEGLLSLDSVDTEPPPPGLAAELRPYQEDGFAWLAFLWRYRLGGVLADDMGLGKTLQSLSLITHATREDPDRAPFLIVAPASVVPGWLSEARRFTPELRVTAITETLKRRGETIGEATAAADVVVISYTLLRMDFEHYSSVPWSGMILDEAQFTKNHQSRIHRCARELEAPFKLAITGTPMENNLMELWSLLSIVAPGLFPNPTRFKEYYARPIEKGSDPELLAQLRRRVRPLMKRRTKEQVAADLPARQEQVLEVELHPKHRKLYQTRMQRERQKVLGLLHDVNANRFTILRSLTLLRQLSLHAGLVDAEHAELPSAKIDTLVEQLADVTGGGHRALVFSQFTGFLGRVRARLEDEGIAYAYLDGHTTNRASVIDGFKEGVAPVFLISLKAGGFGLNLTEADYCFLLDPWWNPATEQQAIDRTHRIGQHRNVLVYRLIAKDTIEEKVAALKDRKAALFSSVMDEGDAFAGSLNAEDIKELVA